MQIVLFLLLVFIAPVVSATTFVVRSSFYVLLMQYQGAGSFGVFALDKPGLSNSYSRTINPAARPSLAGQWPRDVELLQDALLRKHGRLLGGSASKARELITRRYSRSESSAAQLRGIFAEAVYLDKHNNEGYVLKANAQFNDVYRMEKGVPNGGQIKTKKYFTGPGYVEEMRQDYKAKRFIVPDDHAVQLKAYILQQERQYRNQGDSISADKSLRQHAKIRSLGATSIELENRLGAVFRRASAERAAPYVTLGIASGMGIAPIIWGYANGEISPETAAYQAGRTSSLILAGVATDAMVVNMKGGAWRGAIKGNLIAGTAIFATESAYLVYENGGRNAVNRAQFWEELGGSASAITLGTLVAIPVAVCLSPGMGPTAPIIGVLTGTLASVAGYMGGKKLTQELLDEVSPEMARKSERDAIDNIRRILNSKVNVASEGSDTEL